MNLILKSGKEKTLVILGAGATRGALSGTFSPRVSPPLNGDYFKILSSFVRTEKGHKYISAYKRLIKFLDREVGQKGIEKLTMEQVFNVLFISKDLPQIFHKGRGRKKTDLTPVYVPHAIRGLSTISVVYS